MNKKASEIIDKINKHLKERGDTEGLILVNELLRALMEGEGDVLRK